MRAQSPGTWPSYPLRLHVVLFTPLDAWDFYEWHAGEPLLPASVETAEDLQRWDWESPASNS